MTTLTINRKQENIYSKLPETTQTMPHHDKTTTRFEVMPSNPKTLHKPTGAKSRLKSTRVQRKNQKRQHRLAEYWPALFNHDTPKPIKTGILSELIQDVSDRGLTFGTGALCAAVASYTRRPCYQRALVAGGARYDLIGQPCGEVTPQEQKDAETRLTALKNRARERQAGKGSKNA
ncbi:ProQ/FinO family protein [Citrobacter portucalensis]|uniref:ProQ/FINO family protein n=1 Tax=Citrobacter portucalensis TaxID=1639133 RepID=UPI00351D97D6